MKRLFPAVVILILTVFAATASAHEWSKEGECENKSETLNGTGHVVEELKHCYSTTEWQPNVHKKVNSAWSYITAEDVNFGHLPLSEGGKVPFEEPEFVTFETWAGWANPGWIVEEPVLEAEQWVEAGLVFSGNPVTCKNFVAIQFVKKTVETYYAVPCEGHHKVFVEFDKRSGPGSELEGRQEGENVCTFIDDNIVNCAADVFEENEGEALPPGSFTRLNTGMEISTGYEPAGFKGKSVSYAEGGLEKEWRGKTHSKRYFTRSATCATGPIESQYGTVEVSAGNEFCPLANRYGKEALVQEEPCCIVKALNTQIPESSSGESSAGPESTGGAPLETVDSFADFKASTQAKLSEADVLAEAKKYILEKSLQTKEAKEEKEPLEPSAQVVTQSNKFEKVNGLRADGGSALFTSSQKKFEEQEVYKIELGDNTKKKWFRTQSMEGPWWGRPELRKAEYLTETVNARTGEVLERIWAEKPSPKMAEREKEEADEKIIKHHYGKENLERIRAEKELKEFKAKHKAEKKAQIKEEKLEKKCAEKPSKCPVSASIALELRRFSLAVSTNIGKKATVRVKWHRHLVEQKRGHLSTTLAESKYVLSAFAHDYSCERRFVYLRRPTNEKLKCYRRR